MMSYIRLQQRLLCYKNSITWFFIALAVFYIFYANHLIFHEHHRRRPTTSSSSSSSPNPIQIYHFQTNLTRSSPSPSTSQPLNTSHSPPPPPPPPPHPHHHHHHRLYATNSTGNKSSSSSSSSLNITSKSSSSLNVTSKSSPPPTPTRIYGNETLSDHGKECRVALRSVQKYDTELKHIVFGIAASSNLWETRKEYIKVWWRPGKTRGMVWLDQQVTVDHNDNLPEIRISEDTTRFKYTHGMGMRSALRITRVVSETLRLGLSDVRWFVMGDDDTVFVADNVARVLAKYNHNQYYYLGTSSESHVQNMIFSYNMAYGGGGFAISYPLAVEISKMQDRCIQRYPALYGSDDRIHACMAELGVPLTKEPGFHQFDVWGDLLGLLAAHPVAPLLSLHHLDVVEPIFPGMDRVESLHRLFQSVNVDSSSVVQQSICYDKDRYWSITIAWGFVIQIIRGALSPRELVMPQRTFLNWYQRADYTAYAFNTRPFMKRPCQKPFIYFMNTTWFDKNRNQTFGVYFRDPSPSPDCKWPMESPETVDSIVVVKKTDPSRWQKSPRRDCCRVLPSGKRRTMNLWVGKCREGELVL